MYFLCKGSSAFSTDKRFSFQEEALFARGDHPKLPSPYLWRQYNAALCIENLLDMVHVVVVVVVVVSAACISPDLQSQITRMWNLVSDYCAAGPGMLDWEQQ